MARESDEKWICDFERSRKEVILKRSGEELLISLNDLTRAIQEGADKLWDFSEAKLYEPRTALAEAILKDLIGKHEELGGLLRAVDAKKKELF